MSRQRVTLSLSKEEWGFLHMLRSLLSLSDPASSTQLGYNEVIKGMIYYTNVGILFNERYLPDFIYDEHEYESPGEYQKSPESTVSESEKQALDIMRWLEQEMGSKYYERFSRWENSSVFPSGNYILNVDEPEMNIIEELRRKFLEEKGPKISITVSKIIKKCIIFIKSHPFFGKLFLGRTFVSNLYSLSPSFLPHIQIQFLKHSDSEIESMKSKLVISDSEYSRLKYVNMDVVVYEEFAKFLTKNGYPKSNEDYINYVGKFWSRNGFDFFTSYVTFAMANTLFLNPDKWIHSFIFEKKLRNEIPWEFNFFHSYMTSLFSYTSVIMNTPSNSIRNLEKIEGNLK